MAPGSDNGIGTAARFNGPRGITSVGSDMFVADTENHTIRRVTSGGAVSTFAGSAGNAGTVDQTGAAARFHRPSDLTSNAAGNLYVLEVGSVANNFAVYVRRVTPAGVVTTLFNAGDEAAALGTPPQEQFSRSIRGLALFDAKTVALTAGNAVLLRTLP